MPDRAHHFDSTGGVTLTGRCTICDEDIELDAYYGQGMGSWDIDGVGNERFFLDELCGLCQAEDAYQNSFEGRARELSKAWGELKQALRHAARSPLRLLKRFQRRG